MGSLRTKWQDAKKQTGMDSSNFKYDLGPTLDKFQDSLKDFDKTGDELHKVSLRILQLHGEIMLKIDGYAKLVNKENADTSGFIRFAQTFLIESRKACDEAKDLIKNLNDVNRDLNEKVWG
jgi:hypothetical protein